MKAMKTEQSSEHLINNRLKSTQTSLMKNSTTLLMTKAKLSLLNQLGETSWNELCRAILATRLKSWIDKESCSLLNLPSYLEDR